VSRLEQSLNRPKQAPLEPCDLGVPSGASNMISEPLVRSAQTEQLSCVHQNELPLKPRDLVVPSGVSKMISETMVLFCTNRAPILHQH
jgi:hypothetical protein